MPEFVRIRLENGTEVTVSATYAASAGVEPIGPDVEQRFGRTQPASRPGGRPMKPKSTVADLAAAKQVSEPAVESADASKSE